MLKPILIVLFATVFTFLSIVAQDCFFPQIDLGEYPYCYYFLAWFMLLGVLCMVLAKFIKTAPEWAIYGTVVGGIAGAVIKIIVMVILIS